MFELDAKLRGVKPAIVRTLRVPGTLTFAQLHMVLQAAFGWSNADMHEFVIGSDTLGAPEIGSWGRTKDETHFRVADLVRAKSTFTYEYHRHDGWHVEIAVVKVEDTKKTEVRCTKGENAGPPEGCGGPFAYSEMKKKGRFDLEALNAKLALIGQA